MGYRLSFYIIKKKKLDDWKSCLCNLMYLYRTVDWEKEMIMIIGS